MEAKDWSGICPACGSLKIEGRCWCNWANERVRDAVENLAASISDLPVRLRREIYGDAIRRLESMIETIDEGAIT